MGKTIEFLKTNGNITGFFLKILFEAVVLIVIIYVGTERLSAKMEIYEKMEMDLAGRTLMLEKSGAFQQGTISSQLEGLTRQVNKVELRIQNLEDYMRLKK